MSKCKFCEEDYEPKLRPGTLTPSMCDNCYEVWKRIGKMPIKVLNKIVASARSYGRV